MAMNPELAKLVESLKQAAQKATPGNWTWYTPDKGYCDDYVITDAPEWAPTENNKFRHLIATTDCRAPVLSGDAEYIVAAQPKNILAILSALEMVEPPLTPPSAATG